MRIRINLDDDVLDAARSIAAHRGETIGAVVSRLTRRGLATLDASVTRNGIRLFPTRPGARAVTPRIVRRLADETE